MAPCGRKLDRVIARLPRPDPNRLFHRKDKNFAVPDFAGVGGVPDLCNHRIGLVGIGREFHADLCLASIRFYAE